MADDGKKRQLDLLASLDAAFAAPAQVKKPKSAPPTALAQQAYLNKKPKKNKSKQKANGNGVATTAHGPGRTPTNKATVKKRAEEGNSYDPLYGRITTDVLAVGLRNCSLV